MKLKDINFYVPSVKDTELMYKLLVILFPNGKVRISNLSNGEIEIVEENINLTLSVCTWITSIAAALQIDDIFNLYFWPGNNPIEGDLVEGIIDIIDNEKPSVINGDNPGFTGENPLQYIKCNLKYLP